MIFIVKSKKDLLVFCEIVNVRACVLVMRRLLLMMRNDDQSCSSIKISIDFSSHIKPIVALYALQSLHYPFYKETAMMIKIDS